MARVNHQLPSGLTVKLGSSSCAAGAVMPSQGGEGVEQAIAIAGPEGFRDDTFYFAAGSIGNMAGPADPKSAFNHPDIKPTEKRGRSRAVRVQGPVPKPDSVTDTGFTGLSIRKKATALTRKKC